ncbi:MAG TPA: ATP-binding protein [Candidatus Woesebacteria bacterium]|mgnify:CR=1 FL=1|nr:ATP-binding protein [Candidatus Woesebacteria bacterium]
MPNQFTFELSLSVLNHLGRNLYRSFVTILGEAISNSWDADSNKVNIYIDREHNSLCVRDDGVGMTADEFQNKFLRIGYSKRNSEGSSSPAGRPYIGRKGIGKLALLSCADKIHVISKKSGGEYVGGVVVNSELDDAIRDDLLTSQYPLSDMDMSKFEDVIGGHDHGTIIYFENIKDGVKNSLTFLKKAIALYFRFSLIDQSFKIFLGDDDEITYADLEDLSSKTEFLWKVGEYEDPYVENLEARFTTKDNEKRGIEIDGAYGFVASVKKPRDLKILTTDERVGVDLFVNGRLRERDILKHIPTARLAENYLYGQIHLDDMNDEQDRFTSSRESVVADDDKYEQFLEVMRSKILEIVNDWDKWRIKHREDGDQENDNMPKAERKSRELFNQIAGEYELPSGNANAGKVDAWVDSLADDAQYNFRSYAECFVSENLLRKHIEDGGVAPTSCMNPDLQGNTCEDRFDEEAGNTSLCSFCKAERSKQGLQIQKNEAGTSIQIREAEENPLMYMDYIDLAKIADDDILKEEDKPYKPLRNSVMHTSRLTQAAKTKLTSVFDNVVATVKQLVGSNS